MAMETITVSEEPTMAEQVGVTKKERDATKWLHKTKLCVYSIKGSCRLGTKCSFAHSVVEVQDAPNLHKTQICEAFVAGKCDKENCTFAHGEEELRLSPNFKNKLCKWFGKGKCRNGAECGFAHGAEELRAEPKDETTQGAITPPPGLILDAEEAQEKPVLDLASSLTETKAPTSTLEAQVEGMSATIAALHWKMDEMVMRSQVDGMKQYIAELSAQCNVVETALSGMSPAELKASAPWKQTPLKTKLSSKAAPFQPSLNCQAQPFVPGGMAMPMGGYESCGGKHWSTDESTDIGSGGDYSD